MHMDLEVLLRKDVGKFYGLDQLHVVVVEPTV